jgi:hypothetical protein
MNFLQISFHRSKGISTTPEQASEAGWDSTSPRRSFLGFRTRLEGSGMSLQAPESNPRLVNEPPELHYKPPPQYQDIPQ